MNTDRTRAAPARRLSVKLGLIALMATAFATPAAAAGAVVTQGRGAFDPTPTVDTNICGWLSTFTESGEWHDTVSIADDHHGHVEYQESARWTLVIGDDPSTPASVQGSTWEGRNEFSLVANFDPTSDRLIQRSVQTSFEGPFKSLNERITLHIAADGTVLVDETITNWDTSACSTF